MNICRNRDKSILYIVYISLFIYTSIYKYLCECLRENVGEYTKWDLTKIAKYCMRSNNNVIRIIIKIFKIIKTIINE